MTSRLEFLCTSISTVGLLQLRVRRARPLSSAPNDSNIEPYIRIATGDYYDLVVESSKYDALASYICSLAHEIIHYQQWISDGCTSEEGVEEEAVAILRRYAKSVAKP